MGRKIDNSKLSFKMLERLVTPGYFEKEEKKLQKLLLLNSNAIDRRIR